MPGFNNMNESTTCGAIEAAMDTVTTTDDYVPADTTVTQGENSWNYSVAYKASGGDAFGIYPDDQGSSGLDFDTSVYSTLGTIFINTDGQTTIPNDMVVESTPVGYTQAFVLENDPANMDLNIYYGEVADNTVCLVAQVDNTEAKYIATCTKSTTVSGTPQDGDKEIITFTYTSGTDTYTMSITAIYNGTDEMWVTTYLDRTGFDEIFSDLPTTPQGGGGGYNSEFIG